MLNFLRPFFIVCIAMLGNVSNTLASECHLKDIEFIEKYSQPFLTLRTFDYINVPSDQKVALLSDNLTKIEKLVSALEQGMTTTTCPFHLGSFYSMLGSLIVKKTDTYQTSLEQASGAPALLVPPTQAKEYLKKAMDQFETQFSDEESFETLLDGDHGPTLFMYGFALREYEPLIKDVGDRLGCLSLLWDITNMLKNSKLFDQGGISNYINSIFPSLGYTDKLYVLGVNIRPLFLDDPNLLLFSIDLRIDSLADNGLSFEKRYKKVKKFLKPASISHIEKINAQKFAQD